MAILINEHTRVIVQGITGKIGSVQTRWMLEYGTKIVAGVTPGKGGMVVEGIPVFDTVEEAVSETDATASVFFVPSNSVFDAFIETIESGIGLVVVVPEHIPVHDVMKMCSSIKNKNVIAIGPTTPGIIVPGKSKIGILPGSLFKPGKIGLISRSGTLAYEFGGILSEAGIGQSTVIGMGADPIVLTGMKDILKMFDDDPETSAVVIIGEVGGQQEENASDYIKSMKKPVCAYIAGKEAPEGKRMGHAGAIIRGGKGTYESKSVALKKAGVTMLDIPSDVVKWAKEIKI